MWQRRDSVCCSSGNRHRVVTATKGEASHFQKLLLCVLPTISYCRKGFINKDCESFNSNFKDVMNKLTRLLCCCKIGSSTSVSHITLQFHLHCIWLTAGWLLSSVLGAVCAAPWPHSFSSPALDTGHWTHLGQY